MKNKMNMILISKKRFSITIKPAIFVNNSIQEFNNSTINYANNAMIIITQNDIKLAIYQIK